MCSGVPTTKNKRGDDLEISHTRGTKVRAKIDNAELPARFVFSFRPCFSSRTLLTNLFSTFLEEPSCWLLPSDSSSPTGLPTCLKLVIFFFVEAPFPRRVLAGSGLAASWGNLGCTEVPYYYMFTPVNIKYPTVINGRLNNPTDEVTEWAKRHDTLVPA